MVQELKGFRMGAGPFEGDAVAKSGRGSASRPDELRSSLHLCAAGGGLRASAKSVLLAEGEVAEGGSPRATRSLRRYA